MADYSFHYDHFKRRLKRRYDLEISFNEYLELAAKPKTVYLKINKRKSISIVAFGEEQIVVVCSKKVRKQKHNILHTALPKNLIQRLTQNQSTKS